MGGDRERNKGPEPGGRGSRRSLGRGSGSEERGFGEDLLQGERELERSIKTVCLCLFLGNDVVSSYGLDSLSCTLRFKIPAPLICV